MSNKYDLKMIDRSFKEFRNIIGAFAYLMDVGAINEIDLYSTYSTKDDAGNPQDFSADIDDNGIDLYFDNVMLSVNTDRMIYKRVGDDDYEVVWDIERPNEISNDESFFQASTLYDLNDIEGGYVWFTTIMNCYAEIMDFMESDDV